MTVVPESGMSLLDYYKTYMGQQVVFLCARYVYWGVLSKILHGDNNSGAIVLSNAVCVEQSGSANSARPEIIDPIAGDVTIHLDAVEIMMQPTWSQGDLPSGSENKND